MIIVVTVNGSKCRVVNLGMIYYHDGSRSMVVKRGSTMMLVIRYSFNGDPNGSIRSK